MIARAEGGKVLVRIVPEEPDAYTSAAREMAEAFAALDSSWDEPAALRREYADRYEAACVEWSDLFINDLTIQQAEAFHARLYGAIIQAKAEAGRFVYPPDVD